MDTIFSRRTRWPALFIVLCALGGPLVAMDVRQTSGASPVLWGDPSGRSPVPATSWAQVAAQDRAAVVGIRAKRVVTRTSDTESHAAGSRTIRRESVGSGFLIQSDGYLVTAQHVIAETKDIRVTLSSGGEYRARVVGQDAATDLALLKIEASGLPTLPLGDSDLLGVGDPVAAIGNPFGLEGTMTTGIVSAIGRVIGAGAYDRFIQTDAAINPGNSGGPLVNTAGAVVGVNTALVSQTGGSVGLGFAIPINLAKAILPVLMTSGHVTRGWLGVSIQPVTPPIARAVRLPGERGGLVIEVLPNSPAQAGGLQLGDVIVGYDGRAIATAPDLGLMVAETAGGTEVPVQVWRKGVATTLMVRIVAQPEAAGEILAEQTEDRLVVAVQRLTPGLAKAVGLPRPVGLLVLDVEGSSPAEGILQPKDVILEVNGHPARSAAEVSAILATQKSGEATLLVISRNAATMLVPIEMSICVQE